MGKLVRLRRLPTHRGGTCRVFLRMKLKSRHPRAASQSNGLRLKTPHNPIQVTFRQRLVDFSPDAFGHIHRELKDLKLLQQGWRRCIFW